MEILHPGDTRFATIFIDLKSLYDQELDLQAMVTSSEFHAWRPSWSTKGKATKEIILNSTFWNDCLVIVKIVGPRMRLLRIVDSDKKSILGYIYGGMHRARKVIKENFRNKKRLYRPYTQIVKDRWDKQLCKSIHAAAYSLNLAFQYDQDSFCQKPKVMVGLLDVIDHKFGGSRSKLIEETRIFHDKENGFGRQLALTIIKTTRQVDVDDDDGQGNGPSDSDDEDDLITYLEGLDLSSLCDARGGHTSGYCDEFDSGKD